MRPRPVEGDAAALRCLLALAAMFGAMSYVAYSVTYLWHVHPLGADTPLDRFSEARAIEHVRHLSVDIDGRQEGREGLQEAARYIKRVLESMAERAGSGISVDVEETLVTGSFNMKILHHSISLGYRNHTNIIMRIRSIDSKDSEPSLLVNGHFDGPLGSPAAADCGSCVASMLEIVRVIIDSNWIPSRPVIFLFNGAEELFLLGSHGFITQHKLADTVAAFINIEASGTGGPDLVCQSGPGPWPSLVYAQSAVYPMGQSSAQDLFGIIPGDTDYRIFAQDFANIPGLDVIFLLRGYFYHTSYDTVERLLPGSMQARGDNIYNLIKGFTNSPLLQNMEQRSEHMFQNGIKDNRAVYFDYLTWFMLYYSRRVSLILHSIPAAIFLLLPLFLNFPSIKAQLLYATFLGLIKGMGLHVAGVILAIVLPVIFSIIRLLISSNAMSWFGHPYLAFLMFVPISIIGLFLPRTLFTRPPIFEHASSRRGNEGLSEEAFFWGSFGYFAFNTLAYLVAGLGGGYIPFFVSISMIMGWFFFSFVGKYFGRHSLSSFTGYVIPLIPCLLYSVYLGGILTQFVIEKMGMMGSLPRPYGFFVPDILVAAIIGLMTGLCMGPLLPVVGHWLARVSVLRILLQIAIISMAVSSQFFPYSSSAPKRVILQHTFLTSETGSVLESSFEFSVVDANSLEFVFKHAPDAVKALQIDYEPSFGNSAHSDQSSWVAVFPVSPLFCGSLKFHANDCNIHDHYKILPQLSVLEKVELSNGDSRRVYLELNLGSLREIWATVLNITGPLTSWSFASNLLPAPETTNGGPPSYILRLSGASHEKWTFWLEAGSTDSLRVDLAVLDQHLMDGTKRLKNLFPEWADVTAFSSFLSSYYL